MRCCALGHSLWFVIMENARVQNEHPAAFQILLVVGQAPKGNLSDATVMGTCRFVFCLAC